MWQSFNQTHNVLKSRENLNNAHRILCGWWNISFSYSKWRRKLPPLTYWFHITAIGLIRVKLIYKILHRDVYNNINYIFKYFLKFIKNLTKEKNEGTNRPSVAGFDYFCYIIIFFHIDFRFRGYLRKKNTLNDSICAEFSRFDWTTNTYLHTLVAFKQFCVYILTIIIPNG